MFAPILPYNLLWSLWTFSSKLAECAPLRPAMRSTCRGWRRPSIAQSLSLVPRGLQTRLTVVLKVKNPPKNWKNVKWIGYTWAWKSLTSFWCEAMTGNGNQVNLLKLDLKFWKTREITSSELIFSGFLVIWNHSAAATQVHHCGLHGLHMASAASLE